MWGGLDSAPTFSKLNFPKKARRENMITAFIDGDWILYAAGFAGQKERCVYVDEEVVVFGDTQTEIKDELETMQDTKFKPECLFKRIERDEPQNVFHTAKLMIESNCRKIAERFNDEVTPRVLIDGDGNFRSRIATIRPYKGTRSVHSKPVIYNELREYLIVAWDAKVVYDQESDDEMAILQTFHPQGDERKSVIVSVDKDMLQVPGHHLNPNKGFKHVGKQEALERQYVQCIQGDPVDNIAGCYKVGPVGARAAIKAGMTVDEMWKATVGCYQTSIEKYGNMYKGLSAEEAAVENMRLVYLRRERNELWMPPGYATK